MEECNEGIGMKKWQEYFREVLGVDGKMIWGGRERERERERERRGRKRR